MSILDVVILLLAMTYESIRIIYIDQIITNCFNKTLLQ